jgi:hypothetical protein
MSYRDRLEDLWQSAETSQEQQKSRKASVSFSLGLLSFFVSILAGVPAVINGLLSLREIRQSGGQLQGHGLAVWGIALGLVGSSASGSLILYTAARVREASRRTDVV